ncbi:hypothetical protein GCM10023334_104360 [Nonomuraea thailandensis]
MSIREITLTVYGVRALNLVLSTIRTCRRTEWTHGPSGRAEWTHGRAYGVKAAGRALADARPAATITPDRACRGGSRGRHGGTATTGKSSRGHICPGRAASNTPDQEKLRVIKK